MNCAMLKKCLELLRGAAAAGTPCTLSEYQDLIVEFTKDERLHLQRMMQGTQCDDPRL